MRDTISFQQRRLIFLGIALVWPRFWRHRAQSVYGPTWAADQTQGQPATALIP